MFSLFRSNKKDSAQQLLFNTDIHSHILPGIDDGSPNIETSLKLVKGIYDLGIRKTVATPHIISDMFRNSPATIMPALEKLKIACKEAGIDIEISAAAEYMLDDYFLTLLNSGSKLLTIHGNIVLTEQSYSIPSGSLGEIAFELLQKGYKPIMAHPERYSYYHHDYEEFNHLKDMGFLLQVNVLSLAGYYGKVVARAARYLFENDMVDFVGTDMHHERHLAALRQNASLINEYIKVKDFNQF